MTFPPPPPPPAGVLSNLCRATATTALQLATNRPATAKPTIRTFRRTFPAQCPAEEQLCNVALQFFCKTASPSLLLAQKVQLVRTGPVLLLSVEGRGAGLARIVGKQGGSWSNWHGLHQLGGSTRRLLLQAKGKRASDWRHLLDPNSCDLDTTLESRLWGGLNDRGVDKIEGKTIKNLDSRLFQTTHHKF